MKLPERDTQMGGEMTRDDTIRHIVVFLVIGAIAGWLASFVIGSNNSGLITYIISGVIGSFVGGYLLTALRIRLPIANVWVSQVVTATIGAIIVVLVAKLIA
jgi:uncharacterized membrane protein YeaQ/YmgE (transglycosylase-associated protein family)